MTRPKDRLRQLPDEALYLQGIACETLIQSGLSRIIVLLREKRILFSPLNRYRPKPVGSHCD